MMSMTDLQTLARHTFETNLMVWLGFALTFGGYVVAKYLNARYPRLPLVVIASLIVMALLALCQWPYSAYAETVAPLFNRLLGYATVALAIPLATIRFDELPIKRLAMLLGTATLLGGLLPMGMAVLMQLPHDTVLAFATRAVTTPIALNVASLTHAPATLVSFIVIFSGLIGAALSPLILRHVKDERAAGFALGLAAHAIGTAQAWQRSAVAGEYAAFGMAINAVITAIWVIALLHA
jgi:putative effector of murein hydrolase